MKNIDPWPTLTAGALPMPAYTNPAQGEAVARCRKDGGTLYRVTAILDDTGGRFGYDLPLVDAESMARELEMNPGYSDVTLCKVFHFELRMDTPDMMTKPDPGPEP